MYSFMKSHTKNNISFTLHVNVRKYGLARIAVWMEVEDWGEGEVN